MKHHQKNNTGEEQNGRGEDDSEYSVIVTNAIPVRVLFAMMIM